MIPIQLALTERLFWLVVFLTALFFFGQYGQVTKEAQKGASFGSKIGASFKRLGMALSAWFEELGDFAKVSLALVGLASGSFFWSVLSAIKIDPIVWVDGLIALAAGMQFFNLFPASWEWVVGTFALVFLFAYSMKWVFLNNA